MDIKDKVAIVTGGIGGIGFATAQELLRHGAKHVAIIDIHLVKNRATACVETLNDEFGSGRASFHECDVTRQAEFADIYDTINKAQSTVDILVNSAGILSEAQGDLMIDINLKAVINCTLLAIEKMGKHKNGKGGAIVNVASIVGLITHPSFPIYVATKHGVYGFTRSLKEHYDNTGVRVIAICPGATQTPFFEQDWRKMILNFTDTKFLIEFMDSCSIFQPPENVAKAIVQVLQETAPETIWVSDENEPPYPVKDALHYKERRIHVSKL